MNRYTSLPVQIPSGVPEKSEVISQAGLSTSVANRCEKIAKVPEKQFEEVVSKAKEGHKPVTYADVEQAVKKKETLEHENVSKNDEFGDILEPVLPGNEGQIRPLLSLQNDSKRVHVWDNVVATGEKITAKIEKKTARDAEIAEQVEDSLKQKIFSLWMRCYTQQEIADQVGCPRKTVDDVIKGFGENGSIANLAKPDQSAADHATDFKPPIYNIKP